MKHLKRLLLIIPVIALILFTMNYAENCDIVLAADNSGTMWVLQDKIMLGFLNIGALILLAGVLIFIKMDSFRTKFLEARSDIEQRYKKVKAGFRKELELCESIKKQNSVLANQQEILRELCAKAFLTAEKMTREFTEEETCEPGGYEKRTEEIISEVNRIINEGDLNHLDRQLNDMRRFQSELKRIEESQSEDLMRWKKIKAGLDERYNQIRQKIQEIQVVLQIPIECNLLVDWKTGYIGSYECRRFGQSLVKGAFRFDDVRLYTPGGPMTIGKVLEKEQCEGGTQIIVSGYKNEDEVGVLFKSKKKFGIKNTRLDEGMNRVNEAILLKNEDYKVSIEDAGTFIVKIR